MLLSTDTAQATTVDDLFEGAAVSPYEELLAYEYLYAQHNASLKKISCATTLAGLLPHEAFTNTFGLIEPEGVDDVRALLDTKLGSFSIAINNTPSWPQKMQDSEHPTPLIYFKGDLGLLDSHSVSVVGARKATHEGLVRAATVSRQLVENDITVVTGLAAGVDTAATRSALESSGRTIGVIGTPIDEFYPKENEALHETVAREHLLISQVPLYRYSKQPFKTKRYYFPERNELMAAISDATIIVEASDTSGTLSQARACLHQGRPLFIMRSCAENPTVSWPARFLEKENVYKLDDIDQVLHLLSKQD